MPRWSPTFELSNGEIARFADPDCTDRTPVWCSNCGQIREMTAMVWVSDTVFVCSTCLSTTEYCCQLCPSRCRRDIARECAGHVGGINV